MKSKSMLFSVVFLVFLDLAGCRSAPVQDIGATPIKMNKAGYELEDVEKAIIRAGAKLAWQMTVERPGFIRGVRTERTHMADIGITYTTKEYSIRYLDSQNLDYKAGKIHKAYNAWINRLNDAILLELSIPR